MLLVPAFLALKELCRQEKKMQRSAEKVVRRWRNMLVAPAFLALKESAKELKGMRNAGYYYTMRLIGNSFMKWHMQYGEGTASEQREHVANKALRRWQNQDMGH